MNEEEDDIWCWECGESKQIRYVETNAENDVWECLYCDKQFQTPRDTEEE